MSHPLRIAWANARKHGLTDRVTFHARDAGDGALNGRYDLVTAFECVHDMGNPVGVLATMRRLAGPDGAVIVMDERVGEKFTASGNEVEWMMYGWSVLHCLPVGMAEHGSVGYRNGYACRDDAPLRDRGGFWRCRDLAHRELFLSDSIDCTANLSVSKAATLTSLRLIMGTH